MTKLESKLLELGYIQGSRHITHYHKHIDGDIYVSIILDYKFKEIEDCYVDSFIRFQKDIVISQQAFNILQQDLEVLKDE